ncbi:hypothetical protein CDL15_Pgr013525 [Punica granatum]|uniref:Uncharacterized protein n=1 Tax=Punica granatum TaxID=22663 RepID=A0A218W1G5_PUNGR|nr:hypothetical protein CDL15_Pgr013525 [Punica granatum]
MYFVGSFLHGSLISPFITNRAQGNASDGKEAPDMLKKFLTNLRQGSQSFSPESRYCLAPAKGRVKLRFRSPNHLFSSTGELPVTDS